VRRRLFWGWAGATHGAIPAFHFGGDTSFTPASGLARLASHFAPNRIIAVHMGGGGSSYCEGESLYREAREIGLKHPNLFFIQSAKRDCHIESDFIATSRPERRSATTSPSEAMHRMDA